MRALWGEQPELRLGLKILDLLQEYPDAQHIPYAQFLTLGRESDLPDPGRVQRVVEYLTGAESHLLDLGAELIESDESVHRLTPAQLYEAMRLNVHPFTGDQPFDLQDRIFVFFSPSPLAREILGRPA
jgi:hypothetical protein